VTNITICIVDDNNQLRETLGEIISMAPGYCCIASIGTPEEALEQLPQLRPDVVLMDINLNASENGIDLVRMLKPKIPGTNFMMCTVYEENEKIFEALSAGASGYILKKTAPTRLLASIKDLYEGGAPMSSEIARKVVAAFQNEERAVASSDISNLTNREREILELLSRGLMYKEIAAEIYISVQTVRKHVYNIYEKLHVNNRIAAVNKFYGR